MLGENIKVEQQSELTDSALLTRSHFLKLILNFRPHVASDLYNSLFAEFVFSVTHLFKQELLLSDCDADTGRQFFECLVKRIVSNIEQDAEPHSLRDASDDEMLAVNYLRPFYVIEHLRGNVQHPLAVEIACIPLMRSIAALMQLKDELIRGELSHSSSLHLRSETRNLGELLSQWSKRWCLDADWCRDFGLKVLRLWLLDDPLRWRFLYPSRLSANALGRFGELWNFTAKENEFDAGWSQASLSDKVFGGDPKGFSFKNRKIEFSDLGFNPVIHTAKDWRRDIELKFRIYLYKKELLRLSKLQNDDNNISSLESSFTGQLASFNKRLDTHIKTANKKLERARKKYKLLKVEETRDRVREIGWAVRYQIPKTDAKHFELAKDIAASSHLTVSRISTAISRTLITISLKKRPSKSGRKRGTKNHSSIKLLRRLGR